MGNNEEATIYSGVPVVKIKLIIFTLSGFMSALAGLILAARFGSTRPDIGMGLELAVITAVVLGGVDINGGSGSMTGSVLALLLIGLMRFGMSLLNIQGQVQGIAIGFMLILSILIPHLVRNLSIRNTKLTRETVITALGIIIPFVLFIGYFFWSRAALLAG